VGETGDDLRDQALADLETAGGLLQRAHDLVAAADQLDTVGETAPPIPVVGDTAPPIPVVGDTAPAAPVVETPAAPVVETPALPVDNTPPSGTPAA
jgi:hypothetical protein